MAIRHADAQWEGTLKEGSGYLKLESGTFEGPYTWADRFADGGGTNPEELIGAAHAGCYSMFLSAILTRNNVPPASIKTRASVHLATARRSRASTLTSRRKCRGWMRQLSSNMRSRPRPSARCRKHWRRSRRSC